MSTIDKAHSRFKYIPENPEILEESLLPNQLQNLIQEKDFCFKSLDTDKISVSPFRLPLFLRRHKKQLPENVYRKLLKQHNQPVTNLTINNSLQDSTKSFYWKLRAIEEQPHRKTGIFYKGHDTIKGKLNPKQKDKISLKDDFKHLKGLKKVIKEDYNLAQSKEKKLISYLEQGIVAGAVKSLLPDQGKKYDQQFSEMDKPVIAPHSMLDNPKVMDKLDHIVYEENPHNTKNYNLTLEPEKIINLMDKYGFWDAVGDGTEKWVRDRLNDLQDWLEDASERMEGSRKQTPTKITDSSGDSIEHYKIKSIDLKCRKVDPLAQDRELRTHYPFTYLLEQLGEDYTRRPLITGNASEELQNGCEKIASELSELVRNLRALEKMQHQKFVLFTFEEENSHCLGRTQTVMKKGKCPYTGKRCWISAPQQRLKQLQNIEQTVTINYAEADKTLVEKALDEEYEKLCFNIDRKFDPETEVYHIAESFARWRGKKTKIKTVNSIIRLMKEKGKEVGIVTYKEDRDKFEVSEEHTLHFGNCKGNDLEVDCLIIFGTPRKDDKTLIFEVFKHYRRFPETATTDNEGNPVIDSKKIKSSYTIEKYLEDKVDTVYRHLTGKEKKDATLRMRDQDKKRTTLIICGDTLNRIEERYDKIKERRTKELLTEFLLEFVEETDELPDSIKNLPLKPEKISQIDRIYRKTGDDGKLLEINRDILRDKIQPTVEEFGEVVEKTDRTLHILDFKKLREKTGIGNRTAKSSIERGFDDEYLEIELEPHPEDRRSKRVVLQKHPTPKPNPTEISDLATDTGNLVLVNPDHPFPIVRDIWKNKIYISHPREFKEEKRKHWDERIFNIDSAELDDLKHILRENIPPKVMERAVKGKFKIRKTDFRGRIQFELLEEENRKSIIFSDRWKFNDLLNQLNKI